jgi:uncharacterized Rmd1/YagE family protein
MNRYLLLIVFAYCGIILFAVNSSSTKKIVAQMKFMKKNKMAPVNL